MTDQSRVVEQAMIQPVLQYRGTDRDQQKLEPHLAASARFEAESVVAAAHIGLRSSPLSYGTPLVFVVDEEDSVRESIELMIRRAGWQPETFESAQEFLRRPRVLVRRTRDQRDYLKSAPRPGDAKNGGEIPSRAGDNGHKTFGFSAKRLGASASNSQNRARQVNL